MITPLLTKEIDYEILDIDLDSLHSDDEIEVDLPLLKRTTGQRQWTSKCWTVGLCAFIAFTTVGFAISFKRTNSVWKGFDHIDTYFPFGDSYTDTRFFNEGLQPRRENPLGNPPFPGITSSNGINYVGFLTAKYNQSYIKTYNMAFSGATIDSSIDLGYFDWDDFTHRVKDFVKYYTNEGRPKGWRPENTLFSTFYGINDANVSNGSHSLDKLYAIYEKDISDLYSLGARNFLVMNVPPMDRSPSWQEFPRDGVKVSEYNTETKNMCARLRRKYSDITIFEYNTYELFTRVMSDPKSVPQTVGYRNVTACCAAYDLYSMTAPVEKDIDKCGGVPDSYLWLNRLHVTEPIHEAMAVEIAALLSGKP